MPRTSQANAHECRASGGEPWVLSGIDGKDSDMGIDGIISALVVGLIIGALGRLVVPGKQHLPIWLTRVIGIVAAFIGSAIAATFTSFWLFVLSVQDLVAAAGVVVVGGAYASRR